MNVIVLSIFIVSVVAYLIYSKMQGREERVLLKFQLLQILMKKEVPVSQENLLSELNDFRQPDEIKMKQLSKVVYEMIEQSTLLVNQDMEVRIHPRVFDLSKENLKN